MPQPRGTVKGNFENQDSNCTTTAGRGSLERLLLGLAQIQSAIQCFGTPQERKRKRLQNEDNRSILYMDTIAAIKRTPNH